MNMLPSKRPASSAARRLLSVATSGPHKKLVANMLERFGPEFAVILFVWDGSRFNEAEFSSCQVVYRAGYNKWDFARELLTPDSCSHLEFLFIWDDDLDASRFDPEVFLSVMSENRLEVAQPALTHDSYFSHSITRQRPGVGRLTDFVEVMAPVWTAAAWAKWYTMLTPENPWGWGYDLAARSACNYERMGIVDCTPVRHTKRVTCLPEQFAGVKRFFAANPAFRVCRGVEFGPLTDSHAVRPC
jgi:hypothetical protein